MVNDYRLWIGTGNGVVMSVPLSEGLITFDISLSKIINSK